MNNFPHPQRLLYACIFVVFLAAAFWSLPHLLLRMNDPEPRTVHIATNSLPTLYPHDHDDEKDEVTDTGHAEYLSGSATTTEDLWVTSFDFIVHNAPGSTIHHASLFTLQPYSVPECPNLPAITYYASVGGDAPLPRILPAPYALFIPKGTVLHNLTMLHNAYPPEGRGGTYQNVSTEFVLTTVPKTSKRMRPLTSIPLALSDASYCSRSLAGFTFTVPAATSSYIRTPGPMSPSAGRHTFTEAGTIVYSSGHTHGWEGGKTVTLLLNGKPLKTYATEKNEERGKLWSTEFSSTTWNVAAGDSVSVEALYSNPGTEPLLGAMGMVVLYFAPDKQP